MISAITYAYNDNSNAKSYLAINCNQKHKEIQFYVCDSSVICLKRML